MERTAHAPVVSVIVPCKGHATELRACLRSIAEQDADFAYETIVVDSATDAAVADVVAGHAAVRLIRSENDLRPGAARNLAASQARGTHLAFLDADCEATPGWLAHAIAGLSRGAQLVGGPVLDVLPRHPVAVADNLLQFADFPEKRPDGPARYFPSCNLAVTRETFAELGGFMENVVAGEDTAFCSAALERWPDGLVFTPGMRVRHAGRTGFTAFLRHQSTHGYYRGLLRNHLSERQRRWGARWVSMPAAVLKRLAYIATRSAQWQPGGILRVVLLLPLLLAGLGAWAIGFRRGCRS